jgi:hypothetical protein
MNVIITANGRSRKKHITAFRKGLYPCFQTKASGVFRFCQSGSCNDKIFIAKIPLFQVEIIRIVPLPAVFT